MAHRALILALCASLFIAAPAKARKPTRPFPFKTEVHTLPNGLRIVFVPYDSSGLVAYYTLMRVGSRNEPEKGRSGYAHFFEHMMFRGTKEHSAAEYNSTLSRLGLNMNAFTSDDMTVYHLYGPAEALPTVIAYEADRFAHLDYSEAQFKTEAGAILGEYAKDASDPDLKLDEKLQETAYTKHTYRHTTIGYLADVKAMPSGFDYSRQFFRRYYTPDNATVIVVGTFDRKATLARMTEAYKAWTGHLDAAPIPVEPPQTAPRSAHVDWPSPTLPRVWMAWHAPSGGDLTAAAVQLVLNGYLVGPTSPLYKDLVLTRQLVESLDPTYQEHRDPYLFGVLASCKSKSAIAPVEAAVEKSLAELKAGHVDEKRLAAVRSHLKYAAILRLDTADRVAVTLAVTTAPTGNLNAMNELYARMDRLRPADLVAFARRYLVDTNRTTVTLTTRAAAAARSGGSSTHGGAR